MKKITIVGIGMGNPGTLTEEARKIIESSRVLIGAPRMLEAFKDSGAVCVEAVAAEDIIRYVEEDGENENFTSLMSGDVGFFSGAAGLAAEAKKRDMEVTFIPGISSLQYMCARLCLPWHDASIVSLHSGEADFVGKVRTSARTFILTGGDRTPSHICVELCRAGLGYVKVTVGERLSYDDESMVTAAAEDMKDKKFGKLCSVMVENPCPSEPASRWVRDDEMKRGAVPMTKEEIRAVIMSKLRIGRNDTVWDVGAGTGSVSVEAALNADRGMVWAVEAKEEACALTEENRKAFGLDNIRVIKGYAPEALEKLPPPDKVFIGGSGGRSADIIRLALEKNRRAVVAAAVITLESLEEVRSGMKKAGMEEPDTVQIWAARAEKAGRYHMMKAINPVFVITGQGSGETEK